MHNVICVKQLIFPPLLVCNLVHNISLMLILGILHLIIKKDIRESGPRKIRTAAHSEQFWMSTTPPSNSEWLEDWIHLIDNCLPNIQLHYCQTLTLVFWVKLTMLTDTGQIRIWISAATCHVNIHAWWCGLFVLSIPPTKQAISAAMAATSNNKLTSLLDFTECSWLERMPMSNPECTMAILVTNSSPKCLNGVS